VAKTSSAERIPHSWGVDTWPDNVYPGNPSRARYIIRMHSDELVTSGALTRIGRDLVILGAGYAAWLQKQSPRVHSYPPIPPNRARSAAA
jgi:hypothetical protein